MDQDCKEDQVIKLQSCIRNLVEKYPTPFYLYDGLAIKRNVRQFINAFSWAPSFKEYFAVKALPNPHILKLLKEEGCGVDCSSLAELTLAEKCGFKGEEIMFTSNDTPSQEYMEAKRLGAIINLDDISHIPFLESCLGSLPEILCLRFNPGPLCVGNSIIGNPIESKFGVTKDQLFEGYELLKAKGVRRFGLHAMVASNELNSNFFVSIAKLLFDTILEIEKKLNISFEFVNLGGGLGIPYRPEQKAIDLNNLSMGIRQVYCETITSKNHQLGIAMECGRYITGPFGYLVSKILHIKKTYKTYVGIDACMANLMRPGMYNAYHHVTVLGKEKHPKVSRYDIVGSLCENNDKFAIDRELPQLEIGDIIIIHDVGAHGHSMGFNYNGKLRCAEYLLTQEGSVNLIRRAETLQDYFATLNF